MTVNDSKYYLAYSNKLVDKCSNTYDNSINKKPINSDYSTPTEKIETNLKASTFQVNDKVRITKYKNILLKVSLKIGQDKYLFFILFYKLILGLIKLRI